jgi:hypothetical protein
MIDVPWGEADEVWKKLVNALLEGRFADHLGVRYIKVFGRSNPKKFNPHGLNAMMLGHRTGPQRQKQWRLPKSLEALELATR